jgi:spermidine synthase
VTWFDEALHSGVLDQGYTQRFKVERVLLHRRTAHQDLMVFETPSFGRVLALDGVIQTTERDEFIYHEMLVHVPLFAHGAVRRVLIVGGGDGGAAREVLRHPVASVTVVELDRTVVDVCREHLPSLADGAFDEQRLDLVISDGAAYVAAADADAFDIIIVDSTDPIGAAEVLFSEAFYADCKRCLVAGGVLVTQNGVPFLQPDEVTMTHGRLTGLFADSTFYVVPVPTYVGGVMTLAWASDDEKLRQCPEDVLNERYDAAGFEGRYYTPAIHAAAFALPGYVRNLMKSNA